jgi:hypothetical protein
LINGIFTRPQNSEIISSNSNDSNEGLRKLAERLKESSIDIKQFNITITDIQNLQKELNEIASENDVYSPVITVQNLFDTYKGIDWMRLLKGIFRDTNIEIKPEDLVQVPDHQYLSQLSNVIRNQTNR